MSKTTGGFTLPGEAGYEALTLELAKKWGADVIRDSDGTVLSPEITDSGYGIYSTICIIRDHNEWAKNNTDKLQQTFLCTPAVVAECDKVTINLMESFFNEQFKVNDTDRAMKYWQVYDRTTNTLVDSANWCYDKASGTVTVSSVTAYHKYTVSFIAYRIWEEISMYNHTTNNWTKEHLMQIDPRYPETREYLLSWMKNWCETHPKTTVVRFTSMFYNFVWIWGSDTRCRNLFSDWGSYDYCVSDLALDEFAEKYGYSLAAEDFINKGQLHVTHMPGDAHKKDWMEFINDFVISFGKQLIDMVHEYGKMAYVFYDDSWVGVEPWGDRFKEFGFDGLIKCVFSGFEARLCGGVDVPTHELRLHPYLFPVGLGGAPTFMEGGNPTLDAKKYWINVRRGLLRTKIDRIGLGGYLHLTLPFPDFNDYIEKVSDEFRLVSSFHSAGKPLTIKTKVAVLHYWGKLRSWTLSGHFHETYMNDLIHINEALSGLPVDVDFISFDDVKNGALDKYDVVINAGRKGTAWSGGDCWKDDEIVSKLTEWVYKGGAFIGVNEPSMVDGYDYNFRMSHILGIDEDTGARVCHGKWSFTAEDTESVVPFGATLKSMPNRFLTDGKARVLIADGETPVLSVNNVGKGLGIYMSSFEVTPENTRLLYNLILMAGKEEYKGMHITDNLYTECAYFPNNKTLVVINNSDQPQTTTIETINGTKTFKIDPFETIFEEM